MKKAEREELLQRLESAETSLVEVLMTIREDGQHYRSINLARMKILKTLAELKGCHQMTLKYLRENNPILKVKK